jgi:hypothetical protein
MGDPADLIYELAFGYTVACVAMLTMAGTSSRQGGRILGLWTAGGLIVGLELANLLNLLSTTEPHRLAVAALCSATCCMVGIHIGTERATAAETKHQQRATTNG